MSEIAKEVVKLEEALAASRAKAESLQRDLDGVRQQLQEALLESLGRAAPSVQAVLSYAVPDGWKAENVLLRTRPKLLAVGDYWTLESKRFAARSETRILFEGRRIPPPDPIKEAERVLAPFGLKPLTRKGGPVGVYRLAAGHLEAIHRRLAEEEARIEKLLGDRANTVEDNRRWTTVAIESIEAGRYVRSFLSSYLAWLGEEEPQPEVE